ncbi:HAD-IIB family hydrolase [Terriglobus tenax]|uniref:HAD-IIB family hydrolase n=1 Tax=Terriglobus tenax TaxID=1111115 RepID=UPI0021DFCDDA|nr:HAD-IIB family hydrolase [Terriglobus tenax]
MKRPRLIAIDIDGTLLPPEGRITPRATEALLRAEQAGIHIAIATGRRHCYALRVLREVGLGVHNTLISSNGAVLRDFNHQLLHRSTLALDTSLWLTQHLLDYRDTLVMTFDLVGPDGEDERGALVVEHLDHLHQSIERWMIANEPYIARIDPIEDALTGNEPIQAMLCGTIAHMQQAEAHLLSHEHVYATNHDPLERLHTARIAIHRTEYAERDLCIVDILPAGCSKGIAITRLAQDLNIPIEDTLAIGDNWNDLSMLQAAGSAALMSNAPPELRTLAQRNGWPILPPHSQDGVAWLIENLLATAQ